MSDTSSLTLSVLLARRDWETPGDAVESSGGPRAISQLA